MAVHHPSGWPRAPNEGRTLAMKGRSMPSIATRLASVVEPVVPELPVRIRAWDGSEAGPMGAPILELRSVDALRRLMWRPGELGAAQAFVTGEIDIVGDLNLALTRILAGESPTTAPPLAARLAVVARGMRLLADLKAFGAPPPVPKSQAVMSGRLNSRTRDRRAIHHHYDLSNDFYEHILDESMAYSCAYFASPGLSLQEAQLAKLDLICGKLELGPNTTLLDVGCGWGALTVHAARAYGARVTAITIAAEQHRYVNRRVVEAGLGDSVEVRLCDYRDVAGTFDAVSSIEMGEHVGKRNYPTFARVLHDRIRPGGRVLIQQMSRRGRHPGGGPFIESFIAPDMYMRPVGETVALLEQAGLEVRDVHALREHYVATVTGWLERFEKNVEPLTELVGEEMVRVWRLYLVGGAAAFRDGRMGVDQILSVRPCEVRGLPSPQIRQSTTNSES